jgi:hypothetical protein
VVDASLAVKWLVSEVYSERAYALARSCPLLGASGNAACSAVPDAGGSRQRPPPQIQSLGCAGKVTQDQGFQCTPMTTGTVTGTKWTVSSVYGSGDPFFTSGDTNPAIPGLRQDPTGYTMTLTACNDNPDSCTSLSQHVDVRSGHAAGGVYDRGPPGRRAGQARVSAKPWRALAVESTV